MRPVIGITPDWQAPEGPDESGGGLLIVEADYVRAIERAGGIPWMLPIADDPSVREEMLGRIDGLLITGGEFDIDPALYGEPVNDGLGRLNPLRSAFEIGVAREALARELPTLGVCGGLQILNVAAGGTLHQDIGREVEGALLHRRPAGGRRFVHRIAIDSGSRLAGILQVETAEVNSTHHQSVKSAGKGVRVSARAEDGVVEAIEFVDLRFAIGVQWHPERLWEMSEEARELFRVFISHARPAAAQGPHAP